MYSKSWATKNKLFFRGDNDRPITVNEKMAITFLAGATALIVLARLYPLIGFTGILSIIAFSLIIVRRFYR
jgi:hypothetical protein